MEEAGVELQEILLELFEFLGLGNDGVVKVGRVLTMTKKKNSEKVCMISRLSISINHSRYRYSLISLQDVLKSLDAIILVLKFLRSDKCLHPQHRMRKLISFNIAALDDSS